MRHTLCWSVPYINSLEISFIHYLKRQSILGRLKYLFQLDHQVHISLYLMKATALRHCRELASLNLPRCTSSPISLWLHRLLNQFHSIPMETQRKTFYLRRRLKKRKRFKGFKNIEKYRKEKEEVGSRGYHTTRESIVPQKLSLSPWSQHCHTILLSQIFQER